MNRPSSPTEPAEGAPAAATDGDEPLCRNHAAVLARIARAALSAGRDPAAVQLIAVSKTFGSSEVLALARCGQRAFGESYLQEALPKMAACRDRWPMPPPERSGAGGSEAASTGALAWHFIGPIQSNKTRAIAEAFDWVHSVDRDRIARRLSEQRPAELPPLQVCIQVNVSGEASKSGCEPGEVPALARLVATLPRLRLRGLMAIPEPTDDPAVQRARFAALRALLESLGADGLAVDTLSMGMSDDLEAAVAEGATIVRVGTAIFGARSKPGPAA